MATRYDPFRELDRLADRLLNQALSGAEDGIRAMPLDLVRQDDHWKLRCDLPGVDPGSIDIGVEDRVLTIRAKRSADEHNTGDWLIQERATGVFARQLTVGNTVDVENIEASYSDGVLELSLPVTEAAKPRKIAVTHGGQPKVIEADPA